METDKYKKAKGKRMTEPRFYVSFIYMAAAGMEKHERSATLPIPELIEKNSGLYKTKPTKSLRENVKYKFGN